MSFTSPQFLLLAMRRLLQPARRAVLRQLVGELVATVRDEGYHFSDVLLALGEYVEVESSVNPGTEQTRATVAALLLEAARAAEEEGRELP